MSHGDSVTELPAGFDVVARSDNNIPSAFANEEKRIWGVQFHPEASHCEYGMEVLEAFASDICAAKKGVEHAALLLPRSARSLYARIGTRKVVLLISGGVDSCVVAALLLRSIPGDQVHLMYIDTGLMRQGGVGRRCGRASRALGHSTCTSSTPRSASTPGLQAWRIPSRRGGSSGTCS